MKICIGIISYLPNDDQLRKTRLARLNKLIDQCNSLFNLPILIIAQNWNNIIFNPKAPKYNNITAFRYGEKLGITGARKELRKKFLESEYDYLIMLDDDADLVGSQSDAKIYLDTIRSHPGMWGNYKALLLKLFAISKEVYKEVDFPDLKPESGDFFEDMWLIMYLDKKFHDKKFLFSRTSLNDTSNSSRDPNSTWFHNQYNKHEIGDRTRAMISRL